MHMKASFHKKRRAVLRIAFDKFGESGYNKTTVSEIADAAGLSPAALKRIFRTKREAFRAVYEEEKQKIRKKLEKLFSETDRRRRENVSETLRGLFHFIRRSNFLTMIYTFGDFPVRYCLQDFEQTGNDPLAGQSSLLQQFIVECQDTRVIRRGDAALLTHAFRGLFHLLLLERSLLDKESDAVIIDIFIDGLLFESDRPGS